MNMALAQPKAGDANPTITLTLTEPEPTLEAETPTGSSTNALASGVETQLGLDPIQSGELLKRASVGGLGMGGGMAAWKRMTVGMVWAKIPGLPDDGTVDVEDQLTPEERE